MSSPVPDEVLSAAVGDVDDPMPGSGDEEEEEGDVTMPGVSDDSSEEGEDDEEEERRVRDGFIVDEDEEEEEAPRKRHKKHHRSTYDQSGCLLSLKLSCLLEDETLEEDDFELLEENTGGAFKRKSRLTRLRHRDEGSPPAASSSKRRARIDSSDDDLDNEEGLREVPDIRKIWDDDQRGDDDDEDMDDFIDYSDEEEGVAMNEEAREARREEKRQEIRRKRVRIRPELAGIDAKYVQFLSHCVGPKRILSSAWDEIHDVFGDGHEYDWALVGDDEIEREEDQFKPEMKYQDVCHILYLASKPQLMYSCRSSNRLRFSDEC